MMRLSILVRSAITSLRTSGRDCMTCLRLKASNWRVRLAARSEAAMTCLRHSLVSRRVLVGVHQQQFGIAADDGEHVVEVVRHPAGELADGLHLLRLAQLLLELFAPGDVPHDGLHGGLPFINKGDAGRLDLEGGSVQPQKPSVPAAAPPLPRPPAESAGGRRRDSPAARCQTPDAQGPVAGSAAPNNFKPAGLA